MSIKLITNELALADPDFRNDLIGNFSEIEKEMNAILDKNYVENDDFAKESKRVDDAIGSLNKKIDQNDKKRANNIAQIVEILSKYYDVPIKFDGENIEIDKEMEQ